MGNGKGPRKEVQKDWFNRWDEMRTRRMEAKGEEYFKM